MQTCNWKLNNNQHIICNGAPKYMKLTFAINLKYASKYMPFSYQTGQNTLHIRIQSTGTIPTRTN